MCMSVPKLLGLLAQKLSYPSDNRGALLGSAWTYGCTGGLY